MLLYRSSHNGGASEDYSATYTTSVNGQLEKGSCYYMFENQNLYNVSSIVIGNNVRICNNIFASAKYLNIPIQIPDSVEDCGGMFRNCREFNQSIQIPSSVKLCSYMFDNCYSFHQDLTIPANTNEMAFLIANATEFDKNVYVKGNLFRTINVRGMFKSLNNSKRKNLWFNSILNNQFNIETAFSVVGSAITWATMTNGFYNSTYNVYCYYNYSG